jgi:hypothetical protein
MTRNQPSPEDRDLQARVSRDPQVQSLKYTKNLAHVKLPTGEVVARNRAIGHTQCVASVDFPDYLSSQRQAPRLISLIGVRVPPLARAEDDQQHR